MRDGRADSGLEASLQLAQEAEDGGDLAGGVLVDAVQADQGIEDQEARFDALHCLLQALTIAPLVETQGGHVDDGDVELVEGGGGGVGDRRTDPVHRCRGKLRGQAACRGRGRRTARTAFQSRPSNNAENCAGDSPITPSDGRGHWKPPPSRRL